MRFGPGFKTRYIFLTFCYFCRFVRSRHPGLQRVHCAAVPAHESVKISLRAGCPDTRTLLDRISPTMLQNMVMVCYHFTDLGMLKWVEVCCCGLVVGTSPQRMMLHPKVEKKRLTNNHRDLLVLIRDTQIIRSSNFMFMK